LMQLDSAEFTRNILNYGIDISLIDEKQVRGIPSSFNTLV